MKLPQNWNKQATTRYHIESQMTNNFENANKDKNTQRSKHTMKTTT